MPLAGQAFLALWNDIAPDREAEYDQWHTLEHVPERVAVHGFRGARRYVNRARTQHRYLTFYEVDALAVFDSAEYRDLLDHPTPWSASMRPAFSNFLRAVGAVETSRGTGIGAAIACLCLPAAIAPGTVDAAVVDVSGLPRVNAVHVGRVTGGPPAVPFGTPAIGSAPLRTFERIVFIEALDRDAAAAALSRIKSELGLGALPADFGADVFDLAFVFPGADTCERQQHRRAGWDNAKTPPAE